MNGRRAIKTVWYVLLFILVPIALAALIIVWNEERERKKLQNVNSDE